MTFRQPLPAPRLPDGIAGNSNPDKNPRVGLRLSVHLRIFEANTAMDRTASRSDGSSGQSGVPGDFGTPASAGSNAFRRDLRAADANKTLTS